MTESTTNNEPEYVPETLEELEESEIQIPKWQVRHLKKQMMEKVDDEVEEMKDGFDLVDNADSQIQSLILNVYRTLESQKGGGELFDKFYENSELEDYTRMDKVADFLEKMLNQLNINDSDVMDVNQVDREILKTEEGVDKALKVIAESVGEGDAQLSTIQGIIEDDYPELLDSDTEVMPPEEYKELKEEDIEREICRIAVGMKPSDEFSEYFEEFRELNNNELEDVAVKLNERIDVGVDVWYLVLCSVLSPKSQKRRLNGNLMRTSMHTLFIGEISTAKSGILSIVDNISPKSREVTEVTKASFEGSYSNSDDKIEEGVVDEIAGGNMLVEEYDKISLGDGSMMRTVFDNSSITIDKGGKTKHFDQLKTSLIAGANPKQDFFIDGKNAREQIPFKEGELSRFDITVPLINTQEDMNKITDEMVVFGGGNKLDMNDVREMMNQLGTKVESVDEIEFMETPEGMPGLVEELKESFKSLQTSLEETNRQELLIMRDFEILIRLVNIIGCIEEEIEVIERSDAENKKKVTISEETVGKAISHFETLIDLRERLYTEDSREKVNETPKDEIVQKMAELSESGDPVDQSDLRDECVSSGIVGTDRTFYNKIEEIINEERAKYVGDGERYKKLVPLRQ